MKRISAARFLLSEGEGGIADALRLAEHFSDGERIVVVLGDNLIGESIAPYVERFRAQASGARILLKAVPEPSRFGVPVLDGERIVAIEEKPAEPKSSYAVTGVSTCSIAASSSSSAERFVPSKRGELEIVNVHNRYIAQGDLQYDVLDGWWTDAGTFESLYPRTSSSRRSAR